MNVTEKQKTILLEYMKMNPAFARGRLRYCGENKKKVDEMWTIVTRKLNASGFGPSKDEKQWAKSWRDWKSNVLKKASSYRNYASGTGGGSPKQLNLTLFEEQLLELLGPEASGLEDIPQGGFELINDSKNASKRKHATVFTGRPNIPATITSNYARNSGDEDVNKKRRNPTTTNDPNNDLDWLTRCSSEQSFRQLTHLTPQSNLKHFIIDDVENVDPSDSYEWGNMDDKTAHAFYVDDKVIDEDNGIDSFAPKSHTEDRLTGEDRYKSTKKGKQNAVQYNNPKITVALLREKVNMKKEEMKRAQKREDLWAKLQEERLNIKKEKLSLKKREYEYTKEVHAQYIQILKDVNQNIVILQQEVQQLGATYM